MNVHDVARRAGADLRAEVGEDLGRDLRTGLTGVQRAHDRRRRRRGVAGSVLVTAALVGALAVLGPLGGTSAPEPSGPVTSLPSPSRSAADTCTPDAVVSCVGPAGGAGHHGGTSFSARLPKGFWTQPASSPPTLAVDLYQRKARAGVTLMPDLRPVGSSSAPADAHALATWISTRPLLEASDVIPTRIGGQRAWRVEARLRHNVPAGLDGCNGGQRACWPLLETGPSGWETGVWADMVCSYYVLDGPVGHPVAIWAWSFDDSTEALRLNDEVVRSIRITAAGG